MESSNAPNAERGKVQRWASQRYDEAYVAKKAGERKPKSKDEPTAPKRGGGKLPICRQTFQNIKHAQRGSVKKPAAFSFPAHDTMVNMAQKQLVHIPERKKRTTKEGKKIVSDMEKVSFMPTNRLVAEPSFCWNCKSHTCALERVSSLTPFRWASQRSGGGSPSRWRHHSRRAAA